MNWVTEQLSRNVINVRVPIVRNSDWEEWFLLTADRHWDNPSSQLDMQLRHLDEAQEYGAGVIDAGDFFCLMQGKYDRRANKSAVRVEHQVDNYLDEVLATATKFFEPYADNFIVIASGNHEEAIRLRCETDMMERFTDRLSMDADTPVYHGGFSGWVRFLFNADGAGSFRQSINLNYSHGFGGGGYASRGTTQVNQRAVMVPDAHIVMSGHIHEAWQMEIMRARVSTQGKQYQDRQLHLCVPTYKEEYKDGFSGWHVRGGRGPRPQGAYWLRFYWDRVSQSVQYQVTRAL